MGEGEIGIQGRDYMGEDDKVIPDDTRVVNVEE